MWYPSRMAQGLVSRDGWVVHDDGGAALLDENQSWVGSGGWRVERPYSENYRDWMIFAHGEDYRAAMRDFVSVAGPIAMMDYSAYGVWYSKYWKPGIDEAAAKAILAEYKRRELPLHALVLDVGWHNIRVRTASSQQQLCLVAMITDRLLPIGIQPRALRGAVKLEVMAAALAHRTRLTNFNVVLLVTRAL